MLAGREDKRSVLFVPMKINYKPNITQFFFKNTIEFARVVNNPSDRSKMLVSILSKYAK